MVLCLNGVVYVEYRVAQNHSGIGPFHKDGQGTKKRSILNYSSTFFSIEMVCWDGCIMMRHYAKKAMPPVFTMEHR